MSRVQSLYNFISRTIDNNVDVNTNNEKFQNEGCITQKEELTLNVLNQLDLRHLVCVKS